MGVGNLVVGIQGYRAVYVCVSHHLTIGAPGCFILCKTWYLEFAPRQHFKAFEDFLLVLRALRFVVFVDKL